MAVTLDFMTSVTPDMERQSEIVYKIREILWNFSDSSNSFSEAIAKTDLFERLASDLDAMADGIESLEVSYILKKSYENAGKKVES